jgi:hypothetical protein
LVVPGVIKQQFITLGLFKDYSVQCQRISEFLEKCAVKGKKVEQPLNDQDSIAFISELFTSKLKEI